MTVPLIATQSEFLSSWCACQRACPAPAGRAVQPPSQTGTGSVASRDSGRFWGPGGLQAGRLRAGLTFAASKVDTAL